MAYTKLQLKDYIDKWDATKVEHLENGIIANENAIKKVLPKFSSEDEGKTLVIQNGELVWQEEPPVVLNSSDFNIDIGSMFYSGETYKVFPGTELLDFVGANYKNRPYPRMYMNGFGEEIQIIGGAEGAQLYARVAGVIYGNDNPSEIITAEVVIFAVFDEENETYNTAVSLNVTTTPIQ